MISINMTIILLQIFASLFMGLTYFLNPKFLRSCDRTLVKKLNKSKKRLKSSLHREKEIYNKKKFNNNLSLVFIILVITILSSIFNIEGIVFYMTKSLQFNFIMIIIFILLPMTLLFLLMPRIEMLSNKILDYLQLIFYKALLISSKKGFIAGVGFILLLISFIIRIILELNFMNEEILKLFQAFGIFSIILCFPIFSILLEKYIQESSKIK